jgi:formylglycine-generating enzyme required for sulfatase activity/pimeloyl-ACP methyl ester carboxylesterase
MERRGFLKDSLVGAGAIMAGTGSAGLGSPSAGQLNKPSMQGRSPGVLVEVPGIQFQTKDVLTGVDVTVAFDRFLMSPTEVTQREFEDVMGYNPSFHRGPDLPVESVSWWEAIRYCNLRSIKENFEPCYNLASGSCDLRKNGYRLPTEAEWAHAASDEPTPASAGAGDSANLGSSNTKSVDLLVQDLKTAGTKPVGTYPPNRCGLYDMFGNVWEWCTDLFNPVDSPQASLNPAGAIRGLARIIRGGSFMSTTSDWSRGYRSSIEPEYKSRFTGFRVCRTAAGAAAVPPPRDDPQWFEPYNQPPTGYESSTGDLLSLVARVRTVSEWQSRRGAIEEKWLKLLGAPETETPVPATKLIETVSDQNYSGKLMYLQVEADWWEKIFIMMPSDVLQRPLPVVIVPFYDVDIPAGRNLSGRTFTSIGVDSFAYMAVQKGYIAVAIRWFGESYGEGYSEAVANLKLRNPHCSGLGKWVWDAHRLLDYLSKQPQVDARRIGIIGHSLGAKMAMYAAAFDPRITAVVANEGGIGLTFSNYEDYWYFGDFIQKVDKSTDQHELLGLIAPRPFLLIGGDKYDTAESWHYINAARQVYGLYGKPLNIGYFNHHQGHMPTPESAWRSMEWLAHFLGSVGIATAGATG